MSEMLGKIFFKYDYSFRLSLPLSLYVCVSLFLDSNTHNNYKNTSSWKVRSCFNMFAYFFFFEYEKVNCVLDYPSLEFSDKKCRK